MAVSTQNTMAGSTQHIRWEYSEYSQPQQQRHHGLFDREVLDERQRVHLALPAVRA